MYSDLFSLLMLFLLFPIVFFSSRKYRLLKVFAFSWLSYAFLISFLGVSFKHESLHVVVYLVILNLLVFVFLILGIGFGQLVSASVRSGCESSPISSNFSYYSLLFFILLGVLGGLYFVFDKAFELNSFEKLIALELHSLRIENASGSGLGDKTALDFISRFLFSFCLLSFCFSKSDFHNYQFLRFVSLVALMVVFLGVVMTGGRLYILYFMIGYCIMNYIEGRSLASHQKFLFFAIALLMVLVFYFRVPGNVSSVELFYFDLLGVHNVEPVFGIFEGTEGSVFLSAMAIVGVYLSHSYAVLAEFFEFSGFNAFAFGGYSFNLPIRIINKVFNANFYVLQDFYNDPSVGRYATYARDAIADFGAIGGMIFISLKSFVIGYCYVLRNHAWPIRVSFYWGAVYLVMSPILSVTSSGFIGIVFYFSVFLTLVYTFFIIFRSSRS